MKTDVPDRAELKEWLRNTAPWLLRQIDALHGLLSEQSARSAGRKHGTWWTGPARRWVIAESPGVFWPKDCPALDSLKSQADGILDAVGSHGVSVDTSAAARDALLQSLADLYPRKSPPPMQHGGFRAYVWAKLRKELCGQIPCAWDDAIRSASNKPAIRFALSAFQLITPKV